MAINENRLKELLHGVRMALGNILNLTEQEMQKAARAIEEVFEDKKDV